MRRLPMLLAFVVALLSLVMPGRAASQTPQNAAITFVLVGSKITNPQGQQLVIDPNAERAVWDHCCDGGKWRTQFSWQVPRQMTIGQTASIRLAMRIDNMQPVQPLQLMMNVLAPDLAEALFVQAPSPGQGERIVSYPVRDYLKTYEEFSITVGFVSGGVTYTYRRAAPGTIAQPAPPAQEPGIWFDLVDAKVSNPQGPRLTIDPRAEHATWNNCCDGARWVVHFGWRVPRAIRVGDTYPLHLSLRVENVQPPQPLLMQMNVLAPDLAEALSVPTPNPMQGERTVQFPARDYLKGFQDFSITVGFVSGGVQYIYRRRQ